MSDRITRAIAEYATGVSPELSDRLRHETRRRVLDSIGTALGAFNQSTPTVARRYAYQVPFPSGSLIWGTPFRTTPEAATLANGVAIRYFDFNDTYLGLEPLHPSDMIAGMAAMGEWINASGRDMLLAIAIGYEIGVNLCDALSVRKYGWDHPIITAIGATSGLCRMMGLSQKETENAISLTIIPHVPMRQTRAGELSMWKGAAAADAVRHSVYACLLAASGMQGPFQPFEGEMGFVRQLVGGSITNEAALSPIFEGRSPTRLADTYIKAWPVEYHAQSGVDAALQLAKEIGDPSRISRINIATFKASYEIIGKDPEKWQPKTRETADHSLQYIVTAALMDGKVNLNTFRMERITDPVIQTMLRDSVTLVEDDALTAGYPEGIPNRVEVETVDGKRYVREIKFPPGHAKNPMSDEMLHEKYTALTEPVLGEEGAAKVEQVVGHLESVLNVRDLTRLLVV
jgi:2-methylcitrate dehydratase